MVVFALLFAVNCIAVPGTTSWYQQANSDYYQTTYSNIGGYSSQNQNRFTSLDNSSYYICSLPPSNSENAAADINNDGLLEIALTTGSQLVVYNENCEQKFLKTGSFYTANVISDYNDDGYLEFLVSNSTHFIRIGYNTSINDLGILGTIKATGGVSDVTCMIPLEKCFYAAHLATSGYLLDFDTLNITLAPALGYQYKAIAGELSTIRYNSAALYRTLSCSRSYFAPSYQKCDVFNENGQNILTLTSSVAVVGTDKLDYNAFPSYLGTSLFYFTMSRFVQTGAIQKTTNEIFDVSGNSVYYNLVNISGNWAVGDFDKNGENEACYIYGNTSAPTEAYFKCINKFYTTIVDLNITSLGFVGTERNNLVMADFKVNASTLGIGTSRGIFYPNGTTPYWFYQSGLSGHGWLLTSSPVGILTPMLIYGDDSYGFVVRNTDILASCGNGVCDILENAFTCPADCNIVGNGTGTTSQTSNLAVGSFCGLNDSVCSSGWCEYQFCGLKPEKIACTLDSECLSGDCTNFHCSKSDLIAGLTNSKNVFMGNSESTGNLISLTIMFTLSIAAATFSPILAPFVFVGSGIFFTIVGWLSVFIMVGILLVGVIIGVLGIVLNTGG